MSVTFGQPQPYIDSQVFLVSVWTIVERHYKESVRCIWLRSRQVRVLCYCKSICLAVVIKLKLRIYPFLQINPPTTKSMIYLTSAWHMHRCPKFARLRSITGAILMHGIVLVHWNHVGGCATAARSLVTERVPRKSEPSTIKCGLNLTIRESGQPCRS